MKKKKLKTDQLMRKLQRNQLKMMKTLMKRTMKKLKTDQPKRKLKRNQLKMMKTTAGCLSCRL